jgi:hypothetical protein
MFSLDEKFIWVLISFFSLILKQVIKDIKNTFRVTQVRALLEIIKT